uniref:Solute carrier family 49 member 3 n=1 Tax=Takifugu rubripes TaxID=31033 RepID=H2SHM0_TAKRU
MEKNRRGNSEVRIDSRTGVQEIPEPEQNRRPPLFKVYKRRWFVLLVLCLSSCCNAMIWLTFAPVATQTSQYLGVSLEEVNWFSVVFMVVAIPLTLGATWMMDSLGLRITLILGSWLGAVGALVRVCGTLAGEGVTLRYAVVMLGQTLGALGQPFILFAPTKLAALWFPDRQRATANMIASMCNLLGMLLSSLVSPWVVTAPAKIPTLLIVYAVPACISCFLATVGIWSSTPPTPPSAGAVSSSSEPFFQGIKLLLKNKAYLVLLLSGGAAMATFSAFNTLLDQVLCVQGYTSDFAGLCVALFILFGVLGAAALSFYVDRTKRFTEVVKVSLLLTALALIAFSLVRTRYQTSAVAVVCSLLGLFGNSAYPVAMELCVECSYPVGEATSTGIIVMSGQVQGVLYVVLLQALTTRITEAPLSTCQGEDLSWGVSMLVLAGLFCLFACCFVVFFHTPYRRVEAEEEDFSFPRTTVASMDGTACFNFMINYFF